MALPGRVGLIGTPPGPVKDNADKTDPPVQQDLHGLTPRDIPLQVHEVLELSEA
jgi:hypothetical protein